jgi:hypothetical protein
MLWEPKNQNNNKTTTAKFLIIFAVMNILNSNLNKIFRGPVRVVRLGDLEISNDRDGSNPQMIPVVERILHPEYKLPGRYNDIALLRLARDAVFDGYTRPACLHRIKALPGPTDQIKFIATGWGRVGYSKSF